MKRQPGQTCSSPHSRQSLYCGPSDCSHRPRHCCCNYAPTVSRLRILVKLAEAGSAQPGKPQPLIKVSMRLPSHVRLVLKVMDICIASTASNKLPYLLWCVVVVGQAWVLSSSAGLLRLSIACAALLHAGPGLPTGFSFTVIIKR